MALGISLLTAPAWAAPNPGFTVRDVPKTPSVNGTDLPRSTQSAPQPTPQRWTPPPTTWPTAGQADVTLTGTTAAKALHTIGGLPVRIGTAPTAAPKAAAPAAKPAADHLRVTLKDRKTAQKAGVEGLLLSVQRTKAQATTGRAELEIDYSRIRGAYGAGWSSRLKLVTLPACALTTPAKAECRTRTLLPTKNNTSKHTLTATVPLAQPTATGTATTAGAAAMAAAPTAAPTGATVLAATAGTDGAEGSFKATSLSPSGSWSAGGNSGGFGWSVPIDIPAAPGGLTPKVQLSYNSSAVDGRTASTNNQPSWIGEGWEYSPGFIERRYASCENDKQGGNNTEKTGDLCWKSENAVLSLNGSSNELVWDAGKGTWKLANDDGSRVERIYDTSPNNSGDEDSEYWRVTTLDGTQYWFGKNRLPGWSTGKDETDSVYTVPVFGNHSGEQGHESTFAASAEQQGWRWNLDYVVDPHGNAMALYYAKGAGYYAKNKKFDAPVAYTRGGYLAKIDYGLRAGAVYSTALPAGRVTFGVSDRCLSDCTFDAAHAASWPDTPVDLICKVATECLQASPSFWDRKRLTSINTYSLVGTALQPVDTWTLTQSFPATGDTSTPSLWLDSIQRTGKAGTVADITLPKTVFGGEMMANRVDAAEGRPPLYKKRITQVTNETGGQTLVTYTPAECTPTALPAADTNTKRCYPSWWTPDGAVDPVKDWFHKYLVNRIVEDDTTAGTGSESKTTTYEYVNGPHWRRDTSEFTLDKHRSWSDFRGYGTVRTYVGTVNRVKTSSTYFLGMAGDTLADGTARTVAKINGITDREDFAGRKAGDWTYDKDGTGGKVVEKTLYTPWESAATATQTVKGITDPDKPTTPAPTLPAKTAQYSGTVKETDQTLLDDGTWRTLTTRRGYDTTYGLLTSAGDDGAGEVEAQCTRTSYVTPDTTNWLIAYPDEVTTSSHTACETAPANTAITGKARTFYDNKAAGAAPAVGKAHVTKTQQAARFGLDGAPVWETLAETTHDQYGRALTVKGQDGQTSTTAYTPTTGAQPTKVTVTNPKGYASSSTFDGMRGLTLTATDANGCTTTSAYDALGRLTQGWRAGRATTDEPNVTHTYNLSATAPSTVTTKALHENGTWRTSVTLYDSLLRARQTQTDAISTAGRVITDSFYDTHGRAFRTNAPYFNSNPVSQTILSVTDNQIPSATLTEYDNRGRTAAAITLSLNVEKWRTTHTYGPTWTASVPPAGGTATLTVSDVRGRIAETRQYKDRNPLIGAAATQYEATTRTYDSAGRLAKLTDASKHNSWTYTYDLRGRQTSTTDPDKGTVATAYGTDGRIQTVKDDRDVTLATTYDELGRKTSLRKDSVTGTKLAEWTYDTATGGKGMPASSIRYDNSVTPAAAYTTAVTGYDTAGRPTGTTVTVPSVTGEEELAGTYTVATTATAVNGLPSTATYTTGNTHATTALPQETVTSQYGAQDQLSIVSGTNTAGTIAQVYLRGAAYSPFGELEQAHLGNLGKRVIQTLTYESSTRRLMGVDVDREAAGPSLLSRLAYTYDPAGNITRIRDAQNDATTVDDQCFSYDWARRMTEAWTTGDACATKPVDGTGTPNLGGVDPYWTSWTFTDTGQRKTETQHKAGPVTADTTRTYTYPTTEGAAQAHGVRSVTATGGATGKDTYAYDVTGNLTLKDTASGPAQTLTWNDEGKLASSTVSGATTSFLYDAEGTRILKRDPDKTTLYLPGGQELALTKATNVLEGTRYYTVPGGSAIRTSNDGKVRLLVADHHNTNVLSVSATTLTFNRRKTLPYGAPRGAAPAFWPGHKGFVGGDIDPTTSFTHIGAREYDPTLGQFISADPLLEIDKPQTLNGYSYAAQNPVTFSDPTGLGLDDGTGRTERPGKKTGEGSGKPRGGVNESPSKQQGRSGAEIAADKTRHDAAVTAVAAFLRAQWAHNPEVQVHTEYWIPGAQRENGKGGWADIVMVFEDDIYVWEMKSAIQAETDGPATLDRYINALNKIEQKKPFGRSVHRGWELPQVATVDPLNARNQLVAQSTRTRPASVRTGSKYKGVVGWWTRRQLPRGRSPEGMEPVTVPAPLTVQAWQPTPQQQRDVALGAITAGVIYVLGRMLTDPTGLSG
ncbi:RHS repeat domain-containing protein [Streptomyces purpureus]|nr:RHS repeat-associated core domain-containing protein [Streptomyces purpureus]